MPVYGQIYPHSVDPDTDIQHKEHQYRLNLIICVRHVDLIRTLNIIVRFNIIVCTLIISRQRALALRGIRIIRIPRGGGVKSAIRLYTDHWGR